MKDVNRTRSSLTAMQGNIESILSTHRVKIILFNLHWNLQIFSIQTSTTLGEVGRLVQEQLFIENLKANLEEMRHEISIHIGSFDEAQTQILSFLFTTANTSVALADPNVTDQINWVIIK